MRPSDLSISPSPKHDASLELLTDVMNILGRQNKDILERSFMLVLDWRTERYCWKDLRRL